MRCALAVFVLLYAYAACNAAVWSKAMTDAVTVLEANLGNLNAKDQEFARSLLRNPRRTDKVLFWIGKMAERASGEKPEREKVEVGNLGPIVNMFGHYARNHVKLPRIVLATGHGLIAINPAGATSSFPGCIQVKEYEGERRWYGRIYSDGKFELSPKYSAADMSHVIGALKALCDDPIGTASAHGRLTGRCCFCHIRLKDERSTQMGYGPQCAENFGLDWGRSKFSFAAEPEAVQAPALRTRRSQRKVKVI
jgi:hypothetical protein